MDYWPAIAADRLALADLLGGLSDEQWQAATPCEAWTVAQVAAHVLAMAVDSKWTMTREYLRTGLDLDQVSQHQIERMLSRRAPAKLPEALRRESGTRNTPPGLKPWGILAELVTHTVDVACALNRPAAIPAEHLDETLAYLARRVRGNTRFNLVGGRRHPVLRGQAISEGLHLVSTDSAWSAGEGPRVEGSAADLLMVLAGRGTGLDGLSGDGVPEVRARLAT